jgi:hypothetical protein
MGASEKSKHYLANRQSGTAKRDLNHIFWNCLFELRKGSFRRSTRASKEKAREFGPGFLNPWSRSEVIPLSRVNLWIKVVLALFGTIEIRLRFKKNR